MKRDPICGMEVDTHTALNLVLRGKTYYFCCQSCLEMFAKSRDVRLTGKRLMRRAAGRWERLRRNRLFQISCVLSALLLASCFIPALFSWRTHLLHYFSLIWWGVLAGFLLGGVIDRYLPRQYVSNLLAEDDRRTVCRAVLLGFLMSACCHGILALAIELYRKGASVAAVVAFLLASPWANLPLTLLLVSMFGWRSLVIIGGALVIAVVTGNIFFSLARRGMVESNPATLKPDKSYSIKGDIKRRWRDARFSFAALRRDLRDIWRGAASLANMVLAWIIIGLLAASLAGAFIPGGWLKAHLGETLLGLCFTLLLAVVLEVCSEGTAPLAFELYRQTGALGNSFVFLMGGVVTDYTEIGLLWSNIGRRTAVLLPLITVPQVLLLGWLVNLLL